MGFLHVLTKTYVSYGARSEHHLTSRRAIQSLDDALITWAKELPPPIQDAPGGIRSQTPYVL